MMNANVAHRILSIFLLAACLGFFFSGSAVMSAYAASYANLAAQETADGWTDPSADAVDPALDLISGLATVTLGGQLEFMAQFDGTPFTAAETITWCLDTDQDLATGTACGQGALAGAGHVITLQGGPGALTTGDLHLGGALLGEDACQSVRYDESRHVLYLRLPQLFVDTDGNFNYLVTSQFTGSEAVGDAAPDTPSFALTDGFFSAAPGAITYLPDVGSQVCNFLWMDPSRLEFTAYQGADGPKRQALGIFDNEESGIEWSASEDIPWLSLSHTSGITPSHIQVDVTPAGMAVGMHTGRIYFTRPGRQWNGSNWLEVSLDIRQASSFDIMPKALNFEAYEGQLATPIKLLDIDKVGDYPLEWRLYENIPWLHVSPVTSNNDADWLPQGEAPFRVQVWATAAQLSAGQYTSELTIASDNAQNSPQVIPVTLVVKNVNLEHAISMTTANDREGYIHLDWTPVENPQFSGYRVYVWQQNTTRYFYMGSTTNLSYTDRSSARRPYTDYCYYVAAVSPNGTSFIADSNIVCAKTGALMPPPIDLMP